MGSLTSRPKSASPQVVYMPSPVPAYEPPPTIPANPSPEEEAENRKKNLLLRDRGRFGTVLTGFRGLLAPTDTNSARKTLLGE